MTARKDARMVHRLIRDTARDMAGAFYEHAAHDDQFYKHYPSIRFFIDYEWPRFVFVAKQTLTSMLTLGHVSESDKMRIYDALLDDSTLPYSPKETQIVNFPH